MFMYELQKYEVILRKPLISSIYIKLKIGSWKKKIIGNALREYTIEWKKKLVYKFFLCFNFLRLIYSLYGLRTIRGPYSLVHVLNVFCRVRLKNLKKIIKWFLIALKIYINNLYDTNFQFNSKLCIY
jgi:hypothetical protein